MSGVEFMSNEYLFKSYTGIKVDFTFPNSVMFPNLPVRLDKGSVIFPLSGISFCTGLEILLAYRLGCQFTILGGSFIPFVSANTQNLDVEQKEITKRLSVERIQNLVNLNEEGTIG